MNPFLQDALHLVILEFEPTLEADLRIKERNKKTHII